MHMKIAGIVDDQDNVASFEPGHFIVLYSKVSGDWKALLSIPITYPPNANMALMRQQLIEWVSQLDGAKHVIATKLIGLPFQVFDQQLMSIWEGEGPVLSYLDSLAEELDATSPAETTDITPYLPKEQSLSGHYYVDLRPVQNEEIGVTSKQVLMSFIDSTPFAVLEIWCSHVPNWLALKVQMKNYTFTESKQPDQSICIKVENKCSK